MEFRILDLFCGAGGLSCGLDSVKNFKTVIGVDFDKNVLETFKNNIKTSEVLCGDLTDNNFKNKIIDLSLQKKVNMIVGGPPCQGFSLKGKKLGLDDPRNFLFLEYFKLVKKIKPEIFVIENVKNLTQACGGYFINQIIERFSKLGYTINHGIMDAQYFGVPQHRERTIIIGSLSRSIPLPLENECHVTVRDAISDLSFLNSGEGEFKQTYKFIAKTPYQKEMRKNAKELFNHIATSHSKTALRKLSFIPPEGDKSSLPKKMHGKQKFSCTWSRLIWDDISPTIDTRFDTPSNGRNSHPFLNRAITPREAARIQSFPDDFIFYGKKCSICKQIGNAVPPKLAQAIAIEIDKAYNEKTFYKSKNVSLFLDDANNFVKELILSDKKVDAIITDPPYNISRKNNFSTMKHPRKGVDFGDWDKNFEVSSWIDEYVKVLKPNGSIIIFCSYLYISDICKSLTKNNLDVKDVLIWKKKNPMPRNINRRYVQDMEFAVWAVKKDAKWVFNKPSNVPYLRSIFETSLVSGKEKNGHPTQKSLELMKRIVEIHTNAGDVILDPFMGSGTTGVASLLSERKFIGCEIDKNYYLIAKKRILDLKKS